jgi:hypothetical protein
METSQSGAQTDPISDHTRTNGIDLIRMINARRRVNAATEEAVALAMDALHDRAIEAALWDRMNAALIPD